MSYFVLPQPRILSQFAGFFKFADETIVLFPSVVGDGVYGLVAWKGEDCSNARLSTTWDVGSPVLIRGMICQSHFQLF